MMQPVFRFAPVYKDYLWGGDRIRSLFRPDLPPGVYAESWEVADRPEGMSVVLRGPLAGRTLGELARAHRTALVGRGFKGERFPLLVKIIDARETLSVQVHPDEEAGRRWGGEPKTEMWYVLEASPDAFVYRGLKPGVDAKTFAASLGGPDALSLLNQMPVQAGDAIYIPGGCVHAIGAGCLLLEIQQNSNTTYRLHDGGRVDAQGRPRELHVEQGLRVLRAETPPNDHRTSPFFRFEHVLLDRPRQLAGDGSSFQIIFAVRGAVGVGEETLQTSQTALIPADSKSCLVRPAEGAAEIARVTLPSSRQ